MKALLLRIWAGIFISIFILSTLAFVALNRHYSAFFFNAEWYPVKSTAWLVQILLDETPRSDIEPEIAALSTLLERPVHICPSDDPTLPENAADLSPGSEPVLGSDEAGEKYFYAPVHDGTLVAVLPPSFNQYAPFSSPVTHLLWLVWIFGVTTAGGFLLSRPIHRRLAELEQAAKKIYGGDFSARIQVIRSDLIGEVGRCFNQTATRIQTMVQEQQTLLLRFIAKLKASTRTTRRRLAGLSDPETGSDRTAVINRISADLDDLERYVANLLRRERESRAAISPGSPEGASAEEKGREAFSSRSPREPRSMFNFLRTLTGFESSVFQTGILKFVIRVAVGILVVLMFNHSYGLISSQLLYKYMPGIQDWYPARVMPALIQRAVNAAGPEETPYLLQDLTRRLGRQVRLVDSTGLILPRRTVETASGNSIRYGRHEGENVYFAPVHGGARTLIIDNGLDLYRQQPSILLHSAMIPLELVLTIIGSILFSRPIIRNLKALEKGLDGIRQGDLDTRVEIPEGRPIGDLAGSLNSMTDRLRLLITSRKQLIQTVAHEIRTPVFRIHFHLEMMMHPTQNDAAVQRRGQILEEIDVLHSLAQELMTFTEIDGLTHEDSSIVVCRELAAIIDHQHPLNPNLSISLTGSLEKEAALRAYPAYFRRVVQNVVLNALRHARTAVWVRYGREGDFLVIDVCDDGPGIPPAQGEVIFEPFARLENDRNRQAGGYGLGLAIARRILDLYQGTITLSDNPTGGAVFTIRWPFSHSMPDGELTGVSPPLPTTIR